MKENLPSQIVESINDDAGAIQKYYESLFEEGQPVYRFSREAMKSAAEFGRSLSLNYLVDSIKAESRKAMLRKKTKYVHGMENFSSRKNAYKAGWNDCLLWIIDRLNRQMDNSKVKYLIEDLRTGKWLCLGDPIDTSKHDDSHWESNWTSDASFAIQWGTREEAEAHNKKYFNMIDIEVTEHEFIDLPTTKTNG